MYITNIVAAKDELLNGRFEAFDFSKYIFKVEKLYDY